MKADRGSDTPNQDWLATVNSRQFSAEKVTRRDGQLRRGALGQVPHSPIPVVAHWGIVQNWKLVPWSGNHSATREGTKTLLAAVDMKRPYGEAAILGYSFIFPGVSMNDLWWKVTTVLVLSVASSRHQFTPAACGAPIICTAVILYFSTNCSVVAIAVGQLPPASRRIHDNAIDKTVCGNGHGKRAVNESHAAGPVRQEKHDRIVDCFEHVDPSYVGPQHGIALGPTAIQCRVELHGSGSGCWAGPETYVDPWKALHGGEKDD